MHAHARRQRHAIARRAQPIAGPASRPSLGALAAGFGMALGSGAAFGQTTVPTPPPAPAESILAPVKVKAAAEDTGKESLQTTTTTIGKGKQAIRDVPQSLTVVTEKLIDDAKLDTLRQALHYTAGITFAATENGTDQDIRLRGFPVATTGDLLIDGMKDPSQYDRDSFNYERLEILRGSASMLFGRGSTGGVINQVTKKPMLADVSELVVTGGTGAYVRTTGDFNTRLGETAAVRVNVMGNDAPNRGAAISKYGIAPSVAWGIGKRDEFVLGLFYLNVDNVPPPNLRYLSGNIAPVPAKNFYGTDSDYLMGEASYASGIWTHRFEGGGELRTQFRSGVYKRSAWGTTVGYCSVALTATGTCPAGSPAVTRDTFTDHTALTRSGLAPRQDTVHGTYLQSDYSNSFSLFGLRNELLGGLDAARESADRYGSFGAVGTNYNKGGTAVDTPNDGRVTPAAPDYRKTSDFAGRAYGAYAQDLLALTPQWKLLGGLRFDRFNADMNQLTYAANGTVATMPHSELSYNSLWSGRAGVLFQPTRSQSYHVSWGTSFNTSADTYQYTTQQIADVPAEKSRNIEVGAKLDWLDGLLSTRLALFRTTKYHERTTDSDFAGTIPVLSGQRHSQGAELDVVGRITPALEVYASYSYIQEATIDKVGTAVTGAGGVSLVGAPVGLTPRHSGAGWVSYQVLPKLRLGLGVRGASTNRPLQGGTGAASTTAKVPGYLAYDALAEYLITPDVFAQININNFTNKLYGDQLYPGFYTPGETRSVKLTLGLRF